MKRCAQKLPSDKLTSFDVLLAVHLSTFISVINQLDAPIVVMIPEAV